MSNYAALIGPICISGCLTNAGTPNVNGKVWAFIPGTTTPATIYADPAATVSVTQPITLDTGGRVPYSTCPNGVYTTQPIRLLIQDATGQNVSDTTFEGGAGSTGIDNATPSVTTAPFTGSTQALANAAIQSSTGGQDARYKESQGATPRTLQSVIRSIQITPQDFGAIGDGANDDTSAINAAITEIGRLRGGVLYFPPGTYKTTGFQIGSNAANSIGITLQGAGSGATIIVGSLFVYATRARVQGFTISSIDIENASGVIVEDVATDATAVRACKVGGSSEVVLRACKFAAVNSNALSVGLLISESTGIRAIGNSIIGGSSGVGLWDIGSSASGGHLIDGNTFSNCGLAGVVFQGSGTVLTGVSLVNNSSLALLSVPILPLGTTYQTAGALYPGGFIQQGNNVDGLTANVLTGGTVTPLLSTGRAFRYKGTTTGSAYNVNAPDAIPSSMIRDTVITITFVNAAGSAVTGWTLDSIYKTTATIPTTDGHSIQVQFLADPNGSGFGGNWREIARADTTT